jgi:hypothetical protein
LFTPDEASKELPLEMSTAPAGSPSEVGSTLEAAEEGLAGY